MTTTIDDTTATVRMSASDTVLWSLEHDPILRSTITAIAILDRSPDWDALRRRVAHATELMPRLRQRVVEPSNPGGVPRWVFDDDFDLDYHLRRVRSPAPGSRRDVLDLATPIATQPFDHTRPLWEFTLVEGMEHGEAALIQKLHHSITDGEGAVALAMLLLDEQRDASPERPTAPTGQAAATAAEPTLQRALGDLGGRWVRGLAGAANLSTSLARTALGTAVDPIGTARQAGALARSMAKAVAPIPESASPIMRSRSLSRRLDTIDLPLADLKAAAHAAGGTMNDAFLAGVIGGLTRYHDQHQSPIDTLRITMPISIRRADDALAGNHFVPARFEVPCTITDPAARILALGAIARDWQHEPFLAHSDALATLLAHLPAGVTSDIMGSMLKHVDAVATNVVGLPTPTYLAGAELVREYAFAPPSGAAVNVALLSHVDTACIGVVSDASAIPDDALLMQCLVESFDQVLALSDHHATRTG